MTLIIITILLVTLSVSLILIAGIVYYSAQNNMQFTTLPTGQIKIIVAGESLVRVIANVPGYRVNKDNKIEAGEEIPQELNPWEYLLKFLETRWGIYYVSLLYPFKGVFIYPLEREKLKKTFTVDKDSGQQVIKHEIVHIDPELVDSVYWHNPCPVRASDAELKGNLKISLTVQVVFEVKDPVYLAMTIGSRWMMIAQTAVVGFLENYVRKMDINDFRETDKSSQRSKLVRELEKLVLLQDSIRIVQATYIGYDLDASGQKVLEALQAQEIAKKIGEAKVETEKMAILAAEQTRKRIEIEAQAQAAKTRIEGQGTADAELAIQTARAEGVKKRLTAVEGHTKGAEVLIAEEWRKGLGEYTSTGTLVIGNNPQTTIPVKKEE
ncbi:MAG TPA: hypothetical protein PLB51_01275 [Candidatus Paceibacterota bacterium]|nr:hypothetical protein [Candidatus Paceibacterota bacterium]